MKKYSALLSVPHEVDLNQAVAGHEKLVGWVVRRQWSGGLLYADMLQEGRVGLWRALQGYDPERGTAFPGLPPGQVPRMPFRPLPGPCGGP